MRASIPADSRRRVRLGGTSASRRIRPISTSARSPVRAYSSRKVSKVQRPWRCPSLTPRMSNTMPSSVAGSLSAGTKANSAAGSMKRRMSQGQPVRSMWALRRLTQRIGSRAPSGSFLVTSQVKDIYGRQLPHGKSYRLLDGSGRLAGERRTAGGEGQCDRAGVADLEIVARHHLAEPSLQPRQVAGQARWLGALEAVVPG